MTLQVDAAGLGGLTVSTLLGERGVPAAAVGTMSARLGEGSSFTVVLPPSPSENDAKTEAGPGISTSAAAAIPGGVTEML